MDEDESNDLMDLRYCESSIEESSVSLYRSQKYTIDDKFNILTSPANFLAIVYP
jgi:hypothetical protein